MKLRHTQRAAPAAFGRFAQWWLQTIHMIATIAIVTKQQLFVVVGRAAERATLTLDALPAVLLHGYDHVAGELETAGVARAAAVRAGNKLLR